MTDLDPEVTAALNELGVSREGTPADTEPQEPVADTPEAPQEPEAPIDPEVQAYLAKYGGDVEKAVRAAAHQESLIGRQGSELGELRQQLEQLSQRIPEPQQQAPPPYDENALDDYALEDPKGATDWAFRTYGYGSRPYERAMAAWAEENPMAASRFELAQVAQALESKYEKKINDLVDTNLKPIQEQSALHQIAAVYNSLRPEYPDIDQHYASMARLAEQFPSILKDAASSDNPVEGLEGAMRLLYGAAKSLPQGAPSTTPPSQIAEAAKLAAAVSTATTAPNVNRVDPPKDPLIAAALAEINSNEFTP